MDHDRTCLSLANLILQEFGNEILECRSVGGPQVGGVVVLGLKWAFSATCTKKQKNLFFGKRQEVLPSRHWEYNVYQAVLGLCLHEAYSLVKET